MTWNGIIYALIFMLLGVLLGGLLPPLLKYFAGYDLNIEKAARRLKLMTTRPTPPMSPTLQVGNLTVANWLILDGFSSQGIRIHTSVKPIEITLPSHLLLLRTEVEREIDECRKEGKRAPYNGKKYALTNLRFTRSDDATELNTCWMDLQYSDYFNFLTVTGSLDRQIPQENLSVRQKYFQHVDPFTISNGFLFNSFGVNVAVVTTDQKLVLVKRGKDVYRPDIFNSSVNEGLSRDLDLESNRTVSIHNVGVRGLWEEIGIEETDIEDYKLTSVGFDKQEYQYGALGYARLNITFDDLRARLPISKDASLEIGSFQISTETGETETRYCVYGIPNSPRDFAAFLESERVTITCSGLVCYLLSFLCNGFSLHDLEKSFREPHWHDNSFIV